MAKGLQRLGDRTQSYTCFMAKVYKDWVMQHKAIPVSWQKSTKTGSCNTKLHTFHGKNLQRLDDASQSNTHFMTKSLQRLDAVIQSYTHFKAKNIQRLNEATHTYLYLFHGKNLQRLNEATQTYTYFMAKVYKDWAMQTQSYTCFMAKVYKDWVMQTQIYTQFMAKVYKDWMMIHKATPVLWQKSTKTG